MKNGLLKPISHYPEWIISVPISRKLKKRIFNESKFIKLFLYLHIFSILITLGSSSFFYEIRKFSFLIYCLERHDNFFMEILLYFYYISLPVCSLFICNLIFICLYYWTHIKFQLYILEETIKVHLMSCLQFDNASQATINIVLRKTVEYQVNIGR